MNKMRLHLNSGWRRIKRVCVGAVGVVNKGIDVVERNLYSWRSRARGLLNCNSFFLLIIGLEGYKLLITLC
jgi:hypothetical protein